MPEPVDEKARSEDYDSSHKFSADSRTPIPEVITSLDRSEEKKLLWKLDMHVLPTISILYMLAFIDRINIGNAKIQGLDTDLNMTGNQYNVALFIFFIPYILCEVPSNLLLKRIKPSTWLSFIMLCWGLITVFQGVTQSYAGLVACRFFLGLFEAGFVPGCFFLISMYYKRYELQWRFTLFFSASIVSGAWGGLFAYACANMAGIRGLNGWRWIFIIEGLITVVAAIVAKFFIADWPHEAKFLTSQEKDLLCRRLNEDLGEAKMDHWNAKSARRTWRDWKVYIGTLMYFGVVITGYSTSFFTPTILQELGWMAQHAQVMSIPIYIAATIVALIVAIATDSLKHRYSFTMLGVLVATVGYILLLAQHSLNVGVRYFAVYLVTCGGYITQPVTIAWVANNMAGHYKRSVSSAVQIGLGNLGGIVASNIYLSSQAPAYPIGYGVSIACLWLCGLSCTAFLGGLWLENRKRDTGKRNDRFQLPPEELENLGDDHPNFRFSY